MTKPLGFTIVIDSREQKPYKFPAGVKTIGKGLPAGDYSILGFEEQIAIERKSKEDAYSTIGQRRAAFIRELEKLSEYSYGAIVIESSFSGFLRPPYHSKLHPSSAINSLLAWSVRYGLFIWFCNTRLMAQTCTYRLLEKFWKEYGS